MARPVLVARTEGAEGAVLVRSPAVGVVEGLPDAGQMIGPGCASIRLVRGGRPCLLRLPTGVQGIVLERMVPAGSVPVEYGQPLLRVGEAGAAKAEAAAAAEASEGGEAGLFAIRAATEGVFYRRPGPDRPAYVEVGSLVQPGTVLGLVEVMKSFNPVVYGSAAELPAKGTVAKVAVADSAEISFGQVLLWVKGA